MDAVFARHRIDCLPRGWKDAANSIITDRIEKIKKVGGTMYGVWRSQIGLPRDTVTAITIWPDLKTASEHASTLDRGLATVRASEYKILRPTTRPKTHKPPKRQGNYAFRWFETPAGKYEEFIELCNAAWPDFERSYDSQIIGLWRVKGEGPSVCSLLVTRRPNLAMWERSKVPANEIEFQMREKLNRRYDLCDWTVVNTMTLITATDSQDKVRWA